jgi:uncharacterized protein YdeI (BOF family)
MKKNKEQVLTGKIVKQIKSGDISYSPESGSVYQDISHRYDIILPIRS